MLNVHHAKARPVSFHQGNPPTITPAPPPPPAQAQADPALAILGMAMICPQRIAGPTLWSAECKLGKGDKGKVSAQHCIDCLRGVPSSPRAGLLSRQATAPALLTLPGLEGSGHTKEHPDGKK